MDIKYAVTPRGHFASEWLSYQKRTASLAIYLLIWLLDKRPLDADSIQDFARRSIMKFTRRARATHRAHWHLIDHMWAVIREALARGWVTALEE
jgi:hypothetical protein